MTSEVQDRPKRATCWINEDMLRQAKEIAAKEDKFLSDVIERDLGPALARRYRKVVSGDLGGESGTA